MWGTLSTQIYSETFKTDTSEKRAPSYLYISNSGYFRIADKFRGPEVFEIQKFYSIMLRQFHNAYKLAGVRDDVL